MELGAGRLSDMRHWSQLRIQNVVAVDKHCDMLKSLAEFSIEDQVRVQPIIADLHEENALQSLCG